MFRSRRTSILLAVGAVAALVTACSSSSSGGSSTGSSTAQSSASGASSTASKGKLNIGIVADMTGAFGPFQGANSMVAYIDHVNDNGGLDGYQLVPTVYDSASTPAGASQAVRRAIADKPAAILTAAIGIASALGDLQAAGIPVGGDGFVPGWTGQSNLFPVVGDLAGHNSDAWLQVLKSVGATKIAILSSQLETGDVNLWTKLAPAAGVSITMTDVAVAAVPTSADALSIAQRVKASGADGVLIVGLSGGEAQFQADLNQLGSKATVLQTGEFGPEVVKTYGSTVNGMLFAEAWASQYTKNNTGVTQFLADMNKYNFSDEIYDPGAIAHYAEAELILNEGLKAAGAPFTGSAAITALSKVNGYTADGLLGGTSFPAFQQAGSNCLAPSQYVNGAWQAVKDGSNPFVCGSASVPVG